MLISLGPQKTGYPYVSWKKNEKEKKKGKQNQTNISDVNAESITFSSSQTEEVKSMHVST